MCRHDECDRERATAAATPKERLHVDERLLHYRDFPWCIANKNKLIKKARIVTGNDTALPSDGKCLDLNDDRWSTGSGPAAAQRSSEHMHT